MGREANNINWSYTMIFFIRLLAKLENIYSSPMNKLMGLSFTVYYLTLDWVFIHCIEQGAFKHTDKKREVNIYVPQHYFKTKLYLTSSKEASQALNELVAQNVMKALI